MKGLLIGVMFLLLSGSGQAENLIWDASTGNVTGYIVYYSDSIVTYNKNVGNVLIVEDIQGSLNLMPGNTYTFTVRAYNDFGISGESNSVDWTVDLYIPPTDNLIVENDPLTVPENININ